MKPDLQHDKEVRVPRRIDREIKDIVDPIVVRRAFLWRLGLALTVAVALCATAWYVLLRPPTGEELLADVVEAAGGMDNWNAIQEGAFTRVHTRYDENGDVLREDVERFVFRKAADFQLLVESESDFGHVIIGKDDEGYWATKEGAAIDPIVVAGRLGMMCDSDFCTPDCAASMAFYRFSLPFKLTDPGVVPVFLGADELNGRRVQLLEVTFEEGVGKDRWLFFVDADTKLIRKIEHYESVDTDSPPEEIYWSDHRNAYGITFSHRNAYYRSNGTKLEEYVITDVDFATPIPDARFIRPENRTVQTAAAGMPAL